MAGLTDMLLMYAKTSPTKEMLVGDGRSITYKEGFDRIGSIVHGFQSLGLTPGDRVALMMYNQPEYVETYLACMLMGVTPVFVGYKLRGDELVHILTNAAPKAVVVDRTLMERVEEVHGKAYHFLDGGMIVTGKEHSKDFVAYEDFIASNPPSLDTLAEEGAAPMIYTSGTTGRPKGAFREKMSEGNVFLVMNAISEYGYTSDERHWPYAPYTTARLFVCHAHARRGRNARFDATLRTRRDAKALKRTAHHEHVRRPHGAERPAGPS